MLLEALEKADLLQIYIVYLPFILVILNTNATRVWVYLPFIFVNYEY